MKLNTLDQFGFFGRLWCRIAYGHLMQDVIIYTPDKQLFICSRCLQMQVLHFIDSRRAPQGWHGKDN